MLNISLMSLKDTAYDCNRVLVKERKGKKMTNRKQKIEDWHEVSRKERGSSRGEPKTIK